VQQGNVGIPAERNGEDLLLYVFVLQLHLFRRVVPSSRARQLSLHNATLANNITEYQQLICAEMLLTWLRNSNGEKIGQISLRDKIMGEWPVDQL